MSASRQLAARKCKGSSVRLKVRVSAHVGMLCRVSTFTYSAAGRKLHVRILNGNLLVRTGGGYQDLLDALGKLPAPSSFTHSSPLSTSAAAAVAMANNMLAAASSISSPRTPVLNAGPFTGGNSSADQEGALYKQRSSSGCDSVTATLHKLHSGGHTHTLGVGAGSANSPTMGAHARLDLSGLHSGMFGSHRGSTPMGSARSRVDPGADPTAAGGCGRRQSVGPAVAFEAAVQAAVAAAVEAAANAGLDDGMGTSCGGAAPGSSITARQQSRAALLGRVIAAKTAAGTLIEAGMCPPVPVQEEVGSPSSRRASAAAAGADLGSEGNA